MVFELFLESVQRVSIPNSRGEIIPEGGGCGTEGSVAKGFQFGALDGEQPCVGGPQLTRREGYVFCGCVSRFKVQGSRFFICQTNIATV